MSNSNTTNAVANCVWEIRLCTNQVLGLPSPGSHYVFIRSFNNGFCDVNTFSSIEDQQGLIEVPKVFMMKSGRLYPIPVPDCTLPRFSAVDKRVVRGVPLSKISSVGKWKIDPKHIPYIVTYMK